MSHEACVSSCSERARSSSASSSARMRQQLPDRAAGSSGNRIQDHPHRRSSCFHEARATWPDRFWPLCYFCSGSPAGRSGSPCLGSAAATLQKRGGVVQVVVGARIHAVASSPAPLCSSSIKASVHTHGRARGVTRATQGKPRPAARRLSERKSRCRAGVGEIVRARFEPCLGLCRGL
jgi:hypothetical protein